MLSFKISRPTIRNNLQIILIIILSLIIFTSYQHVLKNDFINWDDTGHILEQKNIRSLTFLNIKNIFSENVNTTYIPLTMLSFAVEYSFVKYQPFLYHLDNLLLHLGVCILIFYFAIKLKLSATAAFFTSLLFGIHPMHVESVAWATERKDLLYSVFYVSSMISYLNFISNKNKIIYYYLSLAFGLLSILSKPMAVTLPLVLLLIDWYKNNAIKESLLNKIPFILFIAPIAKLTHADNSSAYAIDPNLWHAVQIFVWTFSFYIYKFIFPVHFIPLYEVPQPQIFPHPPFILAFIIFMLWLFLMNKFKHNKLLIFGLMFYICSIFILLRFDRMNLLDAVSDRFMYLPSLGYCLILGVLFEEIIFNKNKIFTVIVICIFTFLFWKTSNQTKLWNNSLTLWNYTISQSPIENKIKPKILYAFINPPWLDKVYFLRAREYTRQNKIDSAIADFNKSIELNPNNYLVYNSQGNLFGDQMNLDNAIKSINQSIQINSRFAPAFYNLGNLYFQKNDFNQSIKNYTNAIQISPQFTSAYQNRGSVFLASGQPENALIDFNTAIELNPNIPDLYYNRGTVLGQMNKVDSALKDLNKAIQLDPSNPNYYSNRAVIYNLLLKPDLANRDLSTAKSYLNLKNSHPVP